MTRAKCLRVAALAAFTAPVLGGLTCGQHADCASCVTSPTWLPGSNCRWCPKDQGCHDEGDVITNHCHAWENYHTVEQCSQPSPPPSGFTCGHHADCATCVTSPTWLPGSNCRWCPKDQGCHDEGDAIFNHCHAWENYHEVGQCASQPSPPPMPAPPPPPVDDSFVKAVLAELFRLLKITDADPGACVSDVGDSKSYLQDFAQDVASKRWATAVDDLNRGITSLSNAVSGCNVREVTQKLDVLAAGTRWAKITAKADTEVQILVAASDLWPYLQRLAAAVDAKDPAAVGSSISSLLDEWTSVTGGCAAGDKACKLVDGIMRVIAATADDVQPCVAALEPAVASFEAGATAFGQKDYQTAAADFAAGLDTVAAAAKGDSCGLKPLADAVADLSPALRQAIVRVESGKLPQIVVGSADVYMELYAASVDLGKGDYAGAGVQVGLLAAQLRASGCTSKVCIVLEGVLQSLQLGFADYEQCKGDLEQGVQNLADFASLLRQEQWEDSLKKLGDFMGDLGNSAQKCGVQQLGSIIEEASTALHADVVATDVGAVVQLLVKGSDVALDVQKMITHVETEDWAGLGRDMGALSGWLASTSCTAMVCRLAEGILHEADLVLTDLKACEADLRQAEGAFIAGAAAFASHQVGSAVSMWGSGLNTLATAVSDCGLAQELGYIVQEANVLGLGNATVVSVATEVLVHGADVYEDLYGGLVDISRHDYRAAGASLGKVMHALDDWTKGHLCSSGACFALSGIMQYLADLGGDARACKADVEETWGNFSDGVELFMGTASSNSQDGSKITQAIHYLGDGLHTLADAVGRCHLQELAEIIERLAVQFGLQPEIGWIDTVLRILINGVDVINEVSDACEDFVAHNWPGFGYNLIKLIEKLVLAQGAQLVVA